ncbi:MAG: 30S ribosomal protein S8e [Candidatus Woesearchaeota archaeon]
MPKEQTVSKRKFTGGRLKTYRKLRQYAVGSQPTLTNLDVKKVKQIRVIGGNIKRRLAAVDYITVTDGKTSSKQKISTVLENGANRNYVRRNFLVKGAIVQTEAGKVRITSRPGQVATLSGVLVK